jgi:hypothetical protein
MSEKIPDLEQFIDSVQDYIHTRSELSKLQAIEKSSKMAGGMTVGLILFFISVIVLLFISVAGAYAISEWIGKAYAGFLIVGGFYLLLGILFFLNQDAWIRTPMMNNIIRNFFENRDGKN